MKSELLENCLDILLTCINSENEGVRKTLLSDFRFLNSLIESLLNFHENEDLKLTKTLQIIRELLKYSSEMNEHNLKLITEALGDYTGSGNDEVRSLCFQIMSNLMMDNEAAKYLITRTLKTTRLRESVRKLPDNLVSFKFFLMMEDEVLPKDFKYFMLFAIEALHESIEMFKLEPARHALDIVKHYKKNEMQIVFDIIDDEEMNKKMSEMIQELSCKISKTVNVTTAMRKFYDSIFQFFNELIVINSEMVKPLENFIESVFTTAALSKSDQAINLLKTFLMHNGNLKSSEIIIESLMDSFIGSNEDCGNYRYKCGFLQLLEALDSKEKLSEQHVKSIGEYFDECFETFKTNGYSSLTDEDCFTFIYFLSSLSFFAKDRGLFYGKLNEVLKLDFLPLLIVRAHLSRREDILMILFQIASIPNFPNQKIAMMLSKSGTRAEGNMTKAVLNSLERRAVQTNNTKFFSIRLTEDLDALIEKINARIDCNDFGGNTADMVQLYRHKISHLTDQLSSVSSSLERSAAEVGEHQQNFTSFMKMSEKQDFNIWCLHLDNDRLKKELRDVDNDNKRLKLSLSDFQAIIDKTERSKLEAKKTLKLKIDEVASELQKFAILLTLNSILITLGLIEDKTKMEKNLRETKARLAVIQQENVSSITSKIFLIIKKILFYLGITNY